MQTSDLRRIVQEDGIRWTLHATDEAAAEAIAQEDAAAALQTLEIIEDYPTAHYGAASLVLVQSAAGPLHMVLGHAVRPVAVVTIYRPNLRPEEWTSDFRHRI